MSPRSRVRSLTVFAVYAALSLLATYPLSVHLGSRVSYEGDALLNPWILSHSAPALLDDPRGFFDAPAFVPYGGALTFSEHLLVPSLLFWPLHAATRNPLFAHNTLILIFLTLSAFTMFVLVRELTGEEGPALVAGILFGYHTFLINEVPRIQIQAQFFFPLGLLLLVRHFAHPRPSRAAAFAVVVLLCGLSNNYYQLYLPLLYAVALPWLLALGPRAERRRAIVQLVLALLPVGLVFGLLAQRYLEVADRFGFVRELPMGIPLEKHLATRPENWIYGETVPGVKLQTQAAHFTGLLPLALSVLAVIRSVRLRTGRGLTLVAAAGVAGFVLLSCGQDVTAFGRYIAPGPYRLLYTLVPGFQLVRIPERFALLSMFWLSILAGLGVQALVAWLRTRRLAVASLLAAGVFLEHVSIPIRTIAIPVGSETPGVYRWLKSYPMARRGAEVPFYGPWLNRLDSLTMYYAIGSRRAIVNGYTGFYPPAFAFLRHKLSSRPDSFFLETVERLGVDHVVVHPHLWPEADRDAWLALFASAHDRLRRVQSFPEAPPRGEPAWDHGGEVVYQVRRPGSWPEPEVPQRTPIVDAGASWVVRASRGVEPGAVVDGNPSTEWSPGDLSVAGDFLEIRFDQGYDLRGVRMLLRYPHTGYPGPLEVSIRREDGKWRLMRFDQDRADRELLSLLLKTGKDAWYHIDFDPARANAIRLLVPRADATLEVWRVAEIQVY